MASNYEEAVLAGEKAADELHRQLDLRQLVTSQGGGIDVFGAIQHIDLPLLLRPLDGLLGVYLSEPSSGVLVATQQPMSIQRFTAAHELGHYWLKHQPSLDDENVLRRMMMTHRFENDDGFQEVEADAFAVAFMLPKWLLHWHLERQGWGRSDLEDPNQIYQLSLRVGASFEAVCWTLVRYKLMSHSVANYLTSTTQPRELKKLLLTSYEPHNYRGNVWLLTERDANSRIDGSRYDLFVLRLTEHSGSGYLWDIDQLKASGFGIVGDERAAEDEQEIGGGVIRRVTALPPETYYGSVAIDECRPWDPETPLSRLQVDVDLTGPELEGYSRATRRNLLQVA